MLVVLQAAVHGTKLLWQERRQSSPDAARVAKDAVPDKPRRYVHASGGFVTTSRAAQRRCLMQLAVFMCLEKQ